MCMLQMLCKPLLRAVLCYPARIVRIEMSSYPLYAGHNGHSAGAYAVACFPPEVIIAPKMSYSRGGILGDWIIAHITEGSTLLKVPNPNLLLGENLTSGLLSKIMGPSFFGYGL